MCKCPVCGQDRRIVRKDIDQFFIWVASIIGFCVASLLSDRLAALALGTIAGFIVGGVIASAAEDNRSRRHSKNECS